jgi:hypothetical protein
MRRVLATIQAGIVLDVPSRKLNQRLLVVLASYALKASDLP